MANPRHVAKLREGVKEWNIWRKDNPDVFPDLSGLEVGMNITSTRRKRGNYFVAKWQVSDFRILDGINLSCTNLTRASFTFAYLVNVNLRLSTLAGARFVCSRLEKADLSNATLSGTSFSDTVLAQIKGVENCIYHTPSHIDHLSLLKSWPLPLQFLRACGLPDNYIEYLPSLMGSAVQFYSCFISYSSKDQEFADRLYSDLQNNGVRCWFAPEDLKIGDQFRQRIDEAIRVHDKLLLILSERSVASDWVREEVETCLERERREKRPVLFPVRLDDAVLTTQQAWAASIRRQRHIGDFQHWKKHDVYKTVLARLLRDLKA